jgi:exopolysaccharide production protein ExoZ
MAEAASSSSPAIPALQFLRALAATAVVVLHVRADIVEKVSPPGFLPASLDLGHAGVDLFFVVSGFVMVYSSESLFGRPYASVTFLLRRIARIVPLYWLMTSIMLAYVLARGFGPSDASPQLALASYFFIPYWRPSGPVDPLYGIGWTLNYEMFFYVVFASALAARRGIAVTIVAATLASFVAIAAATDFFQFQVAYFANPIILEFVFGMGIAMAYRAGVRLSAAVAIVLVAAAIGEMAWAASDWGVDLPRWIKFGVPAAATVSALTLFKERLSFFPTVEKLGDASYALYLCHPALISVARAFSNKGYLAPADAPWLYLTCYVALCIAASLAVHRLVEKPMTEAVRRVFVKLESHPARRQAAAADAVKAAIAAKDPVAGSRTKPMPEALDA